MRRTIVVLGWALGVLGVGGCGEQGPSTYQGYVEGDYVRVGAPAGGKLVELRVERGDTIEAGAPLFALEAQREQAAMREVSQRKSQAAAQLQFAEAQYRRQQDLRKRGLTSIEQLDAARTQRDAAQGRVDELIAAGEQSQWQLEQRIQSAAQGGVVDEVYFRPGEFVPAGTPVVSLLPPGNRKIRFFVPETAVASLKVGQRISATCDGCGAAIDGTVFFVASSAEFTPPVIYSRGQRERLVYLVEARPEADAATRLHPGQPLDVTLAGP